MANGSSHVHRPGGLVLGAALMLLAVLTLLVPATAKATDWTQLSPLNITHQGGEDEAPSATMYAFERSMKLGSDMLEVDVNLTADDKLVIIHDGTVDRTTNGTGEVADMTLAEVKALDAAHWFVPGAGVPHDAPDTHYVFRGVRTGEKPPPTGYTGADFRPLELDELIQRYPDVPINIEIKGGEPETDADYIRVAEALAAYLNDLGRTDGVMVASFNDPAIQRFHQLAPQIDTAPAVAAVAGYILGNVPPPEGTAAFQVPPTYSGIPVVTPTFVDKAHGDGYGVHVWTINDEEEMNDLFDMNVDGIMTAEPMRLEKVMCERNMNRPPLPASSGGEHCSEKVSLACAAVPTSMEQKGRKLNITMTRSDPFGSKCAGKVRVTTRGTKGKRGANFDFGWADTGESNKGATTTATVKLGKRMAKKLEKHGKASLYVTPWDGFLTQYSLPAG